MKFKSILVMFLILCLMPSCKKSNQTNPEKPLNEILFVKSAKGLNLREDADPNSRVLAVIPQGTDVLLIDQKDAVVKVGNDEGRWLKVQYGGNTGWAFSPFLNKGGYSQDFFLLFTDLKKTNYYVINYNQEYLALAAENLKDSDVDGYKFADMDNFDFSAALPVSKNEKVVIISDKNEIQNDTVESFHLLKNELLFLIFKIKNQNKNNRICIRESYLKKHNLQISSADKTDLDEDSSISYRRKVINALKQKSDSVTFYFPNNPEIEGEYLKDPDAFIEKNFTIELTAYKKNAENYTIAQIKSKNADQKEYNILMIFYNDEIVYKENAELFQLFFLNNRLIMYAAEWRAHTGIYVEMLQEISKEIKLLTYIDFSN